MSKKRHALPDTSLAGVVTALEHEGGRHDLTFRLLMQAPLHPSSEAIAELRQWTRDDVAQWRAECLAFLRSLVRGSDAAFSSPLRTAGPLAYQAVAIAGRAELLVSGNARDTLLMQLVSLVQMAGLHTLRICPAHGCGRLFVKTHKREYCSRQCQNRVAMKKKRDREREAQLKAREAARRRKGWR